jgi:hypothetical protein
MHVEMLLITGVPLVFFWALAELKVPSKLVFTVLSGLCCLLLLDANLRGVGVAGLALLNLVMTLLTFGRVGPGDGLAP